MKFTLLAASAAFVAVPLAAQDTQSPLPVQAVPLAPQPATRLPAGTEIALKMAQEVTTKGRGWEEGDQFNLNVASPVMLGDFVVIPEGTKAVGRITWLTSRGAFGKSGKMDIELEYLELAGRRINIDGTYRQEGNGATLATVGGVIAAGIFAGFITGRSGVIPQGRELMATLESDLPVALPEGATLAPVPVQAVAVTPVIASEPVVTQASTSVVDPTAGEN
ncbi:hypothetical protein [Pelagerythrobacter aerophilus]|nr:hypothetical protein [Pelagerythrobacter aerophilus]